MPPSQYPSFPDGDVLIVSPTGRQWKLHSWILKTHSKVLSQRINDHAPQHITRGMMEKGITLKWKLRMIKLAAPYPLDESSVRRFRNFEAVAIKKNREFQLPENLNGVGADLEFEKTYDNLFRLFYNLDIDIFDDVRTGKGDGQQYIVDCVTLLEAADYLGAIAAVRLQVETYLLRMGQAFWVHINKSPEIFAIIACRLQSAQIFQEAMCHIIGAYEHQQSIKKRVLGEMQYGRVILELAERKALELKEKQLMVERRLIQFYPNRLVRRETEDKIPGRADYGSDIYYWQALTIIRQFFASCMLANRHHRGNDGGIEFYRTIDRCDYMDKKASDEFHNLFAMSTKGKQCLTDAINTIKEDLRVVVADLLVNNLQLQLTPRSIPRRYLTCTKILNEELPWVADPNFEISELRAFDIDDSEVQRESSSDGEGRVDVDAEAAADVDSEMDDS